MRRRGARLRRLAVVAVLLASCSSDGDTVAPATSVAPIDPTEPAPVSTTTTSPPTTTSTSTTTTTTTLPPTTTTDPVVTEGGIVLVANAARVPGAGARLTRILRDIGFEAREPVNAAGAEELLEISRVYYVRPARDVALSVSYLMGDVPILPMPTPPPIVDALDALGDANVLVMLGKDLAGKSLPERDG